MTTRLLSRSENPPAFKSAWNPPEPAFCICGISPAQKKSLALKAIVAIALASVATIAILCFFNVVSLTFSVIVIPILLVTATIAFWQHALIVDYDFEKNLEITRKQAPAMPLDEIVKHHGWPQMFEKQILTPYQFTQHYRKQVKSMGINALIPYYEKVSQVAHQANRKLSIAYSVPEPKESTNIWMDETKELTIAQMIETYDLNQLEQYKLISPEELQKIQYIKIEYHRAKQKAVQEKLPIIQKYQEQISKLEAHLQEVLQDSENEYNKHPAVIALHTLKKRHDQEKIQINNAKLELIRQARQSLDAESVNPQRSPQSILAAQQTHNLCIQEAEKLAADDLEQLKADDERQKKDLMPQVQEAKNEKMDQVAGAQLQLKDAIQNVKIAQNRECQPFDEKFETIASLLNEQYQHFLKGSRPD